MIAFVAFAVVTLVLSIAIPNADTIVGVGIIVNDVLLFATTVIWVRKLHGANVRSLGLRDFTARNAGCPPSMPMAAVHPS